MSAHSSVLRQPDELADLHIFVVPLDLWLEKYRTAFNNIALESVSAGFVRVQPYVSLNYLRDHIEEQLGAEVVPEDYVFLRSVGRCMAVVKENQERLLKAKDFLPPVSYTPEIFILPGTHDSVARPVENAANTVIQTHGLTTAGMASMQAQQLSGIPGGYTQYPHAMQNTLPAGYLPQQSGEVEQTGLRRRDVEALNRASRSNKSTSDDEVGSGNERDQEATARRQSLEDRSGGSSENDGVDRAEMAEREWQKKKQKKGSQDEHEEVATNSVPSKTKKHRMQKKASSSSSGSNQSETVKTVKFIQPEVHQSLPVVGQVSPPTPIPSGRVIASPLPVQQTDQAIAPSEKEGSSDNPQNSGEVVEKDTVLDKKKKGEAKGSKKKKRRERSRSPSLERMQPKEQPGPLRGGYQGISEDNFGEQNDSTVYGEVTMSRIESPPTLSEVEERSKFVQFPSPAKGARRPVIPDEYGMEYGNHLANGSLDVDNTFGGDTDLHQQEFEDQGFAGNDDVNNNTAGDDGDADDERNEKDNLQGEDGNAAKTTKDAGKKSDKDNSKKDRTKGAAAGNAAKGKKVAKKPAKKPAENLEDKYKIPQLPKVPTPPPMKHPQRADKELGEDTPSAKDRKRREIEELKAELRKAKNARVDMEKERETKVRRAKMLQNQMMQKRNQSKNIWKKKFFDEKRKTGALDEQVNRLRHEVDVQHKALMSYLESKEREGNKPQAGSDYKSPSEKTNLRMQLAKLQHEVEELRRRIEELKMKLTAEMKNRDAAQKELKQIRQDLMEKKINLTLTKSQKSLATLANPENIVV